MNFLELVKKAWEKAGQSGEGPASVASAVGHQKRFVNWVRDAWTEIQQESSEWSFLKADKVCALVAGQDSFTLAELALTDLQDILAIYILVNGKYQPVKLIRSPSSASNILQQNKTAGCPLVCYFANDAFTFDSVPDAAYQIKIHYLRLPQELAANADVPICNASYHSAIWWRAVKSYARYDEDQAMYAEATEQSEKVLMLMHSKLKPEIQFGRSAF
jgi:hypothetical protein